MKKQDKMNGLQIVELTEDEKLEAIKDRERQTALHNHNQGVLSEAECGCLPLMLDENIEIYVGVRPDGTCNFHLISHGVPAFFVAYTLALLDVRLPESGCAATESIRCSTT